MPNEQDLIKNMEKVFDNYILKLLSGENSIKIENLRKYTGMIFKPKINTNCIQCGSGPSNPLLAIDIDGSVYPCDYFWEKSEFRIGDIFNDSLDDLASKNTNFRNYRKIEDIKKCSECDWKVFCGGGCPGSAPDLASKGEYCKYNQVMLTYVTKKIPLIHEKKLIKKILNK